ncbi:MAG: 3-deoxy-D-manno-octulosonic acid transferase [Succinivibrio sp.]
MHIRSHLTLALYKTLTCFAAPLGAMFLAYKKRHDPAYGRRFFNLLGLYGKKLNGSVWFHAASVGEVNALLPLIRKFQSAHKDTPIVLSTMTTTGAASAASLKGVHVVISPLDAPYAVCGFFRAFKPKILVIIDTELWPNILSKACKNNVPVLIVNARMQEKNTESYLKYPVIVKDLIASKLTSVMCMSHADKARFERIGCDSDKVKVTGNIKYDLTPKDELYLKAKQTKHSEGLNNVFGAISIHDGEETTVVSSYLKAKKHISDLKMIIVPRHMNTVDNIKKVLEKHKLNYELRSEQIKGFTKKYDVLIGDTLGEIEHYFGLCDLVLMGGSFDTTGGHNPLEPAYFSIPVLTGPNYHNFEEQFDLMIEKGGAFLCLDDEKTASYIVKLLNDKELLRLTGIRALDIQQQGRGALQRTLCEIDMLLIQS